MVRNIIGVVVGYVAIFLAVFITYSLAFFVLGVDGSYQEGSYNVSGIWIIVSLILSFVSAAVGGYVCKVIAKQDQAVKILAVVALVLGFVMAYSEASKVHEDLSRPDEVAVMEAMMKSVQPPWVGFVVTLIQVGGILYGGRLVHAGGEEAVE